MNEAEALRAYFDAHMEMQNAIDAEKFGRAYVKANQARDRLLQLASHESKSSGSTWRQSSNQRDEKE